MESYQIVAGFSDIKIELLAKTRTQKTMEELVLWFSTEEDMLFVHDHSNHGVNIILAIKSESSGEVFNDEYRLRGFIPFGF